MELPANVAFFDGPAFGLANFKPGVLRCDDDGLAFVQKGSDALVALSTSEIAAVSISTHMFGADDLYVATKAGGTWSIKVKGAAAIVEALRASGVTVKP